MPNRMLSRIVLGLAAALSVLGAGTAGAVTAPILVADVDSGKVIYAQAATDPWYPASITKLMTTYVALDLVRQGRLSLDSLITISAAAAAEPPSKMGFRPGTQLTLDNALKIIMVKSANDVAWAIGENLGGSIEGFAAMMNETAQRIGMRESRWTNPNGLPDARQWTSARDMAVLARALMRDFPDSRPLFSISAIQFGKSVMANHNGLLGRYAGADGMKTGFICSGGFNVVATATRNGRRIITIVMGQPSPRERDLKASDLFDYGFGQSAGWNAQTLDGLATSSISEPPDMRPYICDKRKAMPVDEGPGAIAGEAGNAQILAAAAPPGSALALGTLNSAALRGRALPARAPLQPILVWIGRDPAEGAIALNEQADAEKAERAQTLAAARKAKLDAVAAKREAIKQAKSDANKSDVKAPAARIAGKPAAKPEPRKALARGRGTIPSSASAYVPAETTPILEGATKLKLNASRKPAAKVAHTTDGKAAAKPDHKVAPKPTGKAAAKPAAKAASKASAED